MGVVTPGMPRKKPRPAEFTEVDFSLLFRAMCDDLQERAVLNMYRIALTDSQVVIIR